MRDRNCGHGIWEVVYDPLEPGKALARFFKEHPELEEKTRTNHNIDQGIYLYVISTKWNPEIASIKLSPA